MKKWEKREKPLKTFDELYEEYFETDESETMSNADKICNEFNKFLFEMNDESRKKWLNEHNLPVKESDQHPVNDVSVEDYLLLLTQKIQSLTKTVEELREEIKDMRTATVLASAYYNAELNDLTHSVVCLECFTGVPKESEMFDV